jgi:hypothetical protein
MRSGFNHAHRGAVAQDVGALNALMALNFG